RKRHIRVRPSAGLSCSPISSDDTQAVPRCGLPRGVASSRPATWSCSLRRQRAPTSFETKGLCRVLRDPEFAVFATGSIVVTHARKGRRMAEYVQLGAVKTWYDEHGSGDPLVVVQ